MNYDLSRTWLEVFPAGMSIFLNDNIDFFLKEFFDNLKSEKNRHCLKNRHARKSSVEPSS